MRDDPMPSDLRPRRPEWRRAPDAHPLAALAETLERTYLLSLDRLPSAVDAAAELLDVRVVLYLVDYASTQLVPFPGAHGGTRSPLDVDTTAAGSSFRNLSRVTSRDPQPRMWVPLVDGVERLGVLDVMVEDEQRLDSPELAEQLWWFAHNLGHIITAANPLGDAVDRVRRQQPRSIAAELIWQLLPPLTTGTERIVISALIEPSNDIGGDVFDYSVDGDKAAVAVFDATGHDLGAGLVAATALSAYRNARRDGRSLSAQAEAVDSAISEQFAGETFATGVVAELDLATGLLRYVAAGHPYPLVLRGGHVVHELLGGRRTIFGVHHGPEVAVGEEQLEPGDVLALYTDGVTEARDEGGEAFGVEGFSRFLEAEFTTDVPLPEVTRRLSLATLARQRGVLTDDTTILLAHWTTETQRHLDPPPLHG